MKVLNAGVLNSLTKATYRSLAEIIQHASYSTTVVRVFNVLDIPRSKVSLRMSDPIAILVKNLLTFKIKRL